MAVIGAGVIGAAITSRLAERGLDVAVLESEARACTGISSRNSGVIHSGLYYPPGSIKATSCIRGQALLYEWCERYQVPHSRTGKLVLGDSVEVEALYEKAVDLGARGLKLIGPRAITALEPTVAIHEAALFCAFSGIVDAHMLTASLLAHAKEHGALFETRAALKGARQGADGWELSTSRGPLKAQRVVNAAGLFADEVASFFGAASPTVYPCRGDYFRWQTKTRFKHLLYPVKKSSARGLGVHLTLELDGGIKLGPDAQYVHSKTDFGPADDKRDAFLRAAERLVGAIEPGRLRWDSCGIRPKMRGPDDTGEKDFLILEEPAGVIHMLGIESPGLTAALALAEEVSGRL